MDKNDPAYKTHFVRKIKDDPDSEITCPRLKITRCNYCHELGHTVISCNKRKLHSAYDKRRNNVIEDNCDDSDSEETETEPEPETERYDTTPRKPTWASRFDSKPNICNAPIPLTRTLTRFGIETKPLPLPLPSQSAVVNQQQPEPQPEIIKTPKKVISWADDDSDDE